MEDFKPCPLGINCIGECETEEDINNDFPWRKLKLALQKETV